MDAAQRRQLAFLSGSSILIGLSMAFVAQFLLRLIALITGLAFFGTLGVDTVSPAGHALGAWVFLVPVVGGLVVGLMARYGSPAIRGHGIPEAMEQVLLNQSRIPPRVFFLKPLSAAVAIGTGGPFGAEGPIIATGGSFGSLIGQLFRTTPVERKVLLAAGAAAGMSATFGSPISAVILAIELLLFEFHPRSLVPVALASAAAAGMRLALVGGEAVFAIPALAAPSAPSIAAYALIGALVGLGSVGVTKAVYAVEDAFERLPIHWMWWPAIGAVAVGFFGWLEPRTLGVGYENIVDILSGRLATPGPSRLCLLKFASWAVALGSGTSGGTLAPLLTIGAGAGKLLGNVVGLFAPGAGVDSRMSAMVGMAALFAGASGAPLASIVFALETTLEPHAILPLLAGGIAAYLVSKLLMRHTIMTEKIARRGVRIPAGSTADFLERVHVGDLASKPAVCVASSDTIGKLRAWASSGKSGASHQGYPVVDKAEELVGIVTRRDFLALEQAADATVASLVRRPPVAISETASARDAVRVMVRERVGRLPVLSAREPRRVVGILTRRDVLAAYHGDEELGAAEISLRLRT